MKSKKFNIQEWKKTFLEGDLNPWDGGTRSNKDDAITSRHTDKDYNGEDLYQVTYKKPHKKNGIPVHYGTGLASYNRMYKSDAVKIAKQDPGWVIEKMTWLKKQKPKGTTHPKDISKMGEFEKFANQLENSGWEFKDFPSKYKSLLDKKSSDGSVDNDSYITGVDVYFSGEDWAAYYVTNGKEDWYLLVQMTASGKDEAVKGSPKFRSI